MLKVKLEASLRVGRDTLYPVPPELIALLRAIRRHGSLVQAIREASISYRHAWGLIARWEAITGQKLAILTRGQGIGLTPFAARLNAREHYVVWLLSRYQGLMIAKGRGPRVRTLGDVARRGLTFVNRERGSGTRLLLDALLAREAIDPASIKGYGHEEFTHMATAATVRAGMADAAFGIEAAARAHGLSFVKLVTERYYLACRRNKPARIAVDTMAASAQSGAFARVVARIGGYDLDAAGSRVQLRELFGPWGR